MCVVALSNAAICLSVSVCLSVCLSLRPCVCLSVCLPLCLCLSVCIMPPAQKGALHVHGYCRTLIGNPVLEAKPTGAYRFSLSGQYLVCHFTHALIVLVYHVNSGFINMYYCTSWNRDIEAQRNVRLLAARISYALSKPTACRHFYTATRFLPVCRRRWH